MCIWSICYIGTRCHHKCHPKNYLNFGVKLKETKEINTMGHKVNVIQYGLWGGINLTMENVVFNVYIVFVLLLLCDMLSTLT